MTEKKENSTLLIVDDDAAVRMALRRVLERRGHTIIEASCGADAPERYNTGMLSRSWNLVWTTMSW